jgi:hypothetical protein
MAARNGLERWRGEVTAKLDQLLTWTERHEQSLDEHKAADAAAFGRIDTRFATVEKTQATVAGKIAVFSALAGAVLGGLAETLAHRVLGF